MYNVNEGEKHASVYGLNGKIHVCTSNRFSNQVRRTIGHARIIRICQQLITHSQFCERSLLVARARTIYPPSRISVKVA